MKTVQATAFKVKSTTQALSS